MDKESIDPKDQNKKEEKKSKSLLTESQKQSEKIVSELKKDLKLFKDDLGNAYARIKNNNHYENWPIAIRNKNFKVWVAHKGRAILGAAPSESAVKEVITTLEGEALYDVADEYTLFNRVGFEATSDKYKFWYDLANDDWSAIEITSKGWKVIKNPPILFKRYQHQLPQITPKEKGNDINLLDKYLRLAEEQDKILIYAFLVTSLIADILHVCIILHGQQGSSKTTLFKILRSLIDPSRLEAISLGTNKRDLIINLDQNWFCPFDNISGFKKNISDIFCQIITGAGFCSRTLFTDDTPFIRNIKRVIGLKGINVAAVQPDLLERSIMIELQTIDKKSRMSEEELWKEFDIDKIKIFGGMLDVLYKAIAIKSNVIITSKERMADFMGWGEAISRVMGYSDGYFLSAYEKNLSEISAQGVESDCAAASIKVMVEEKMDYEYSRAVGELNYPILIWDGAPAEFINKLTLIAKNNKIIDDERDKFWTGKANAMSRQLNRIKPTLKPEGIIITTGERTATGRKITIVYQEPENTDSTNNINNTSSPENKSPKGKGTLNNRIMTDGDIRIDTSKKIDTNSPGLPWNRGANKSQDDGYVGNDDNTDELDVDKMDFS